jgi:hypothetical protein
MKYKEFISTFKDHIEGLNELEMKALLLEIARKVKEDKREQFLSNLYTTTPKDHSDEIKKAYELLIKIEDEEVYFAAEWYETYESYGPWGGVEHTDYSDPEGLASKLEDCIDLIIQLADEKNYSESLKLLEKLFDLTYFAYEETSGEFYDLLLTDVLAEGLVKGGIDCLRSLHMYCIYQMKSGQARMNKMWAWLSSSLYVDYQFEKMLMVGPEKLNDIELFMSEFNHFIRNKEGKIATRILNETLIYVESNQLEIAIEVAETHPAVFLNLVKAASDSEKIKIGHHALDYIPENLMIRSQIATILAKIYIERNNKIDLEKQLMAIYLSKSTPFNFMQLFMGCSNENIHHVYKLTANEDLIDNEGYLDKGELSVNYQTNEFRQIIKILNGNVEEVLNFCDENPKYLGWSQHCLGVVIPLLMLLLEEGNRINSKAKNKILSLVEERMKMRDNDEKVINFEQALNLCKSRVILDKDKLQIRKWINKHLIERVDAVVGGGYSNSYYKVAEMVVYFSEVLSSLGENGARDKTIESYRKMHSRKSKFKREMYALTGN